MKSENKPNKYPYIQQYDCARSFEDNLSIATNIHMPPFERIRGCEYKLFDYPIRSRIGIAACPLTATAEQVKHCAQLGFDIITFKTIRSYASLAHPPANIGYAHAITQDYVLASDKASDTFSLVNSVGSPSKSLDNSIEEIMRARLYLHDGQLLIVSVLPTGNTPKELIEDAQKICRAVEQARAHAIELNCSCPNVHGIPLDQDIDLLTQVIKDITNTISIPLTIKISVQEPEQLEKILHAAARAGARGISLINAQRVKVITENGSPFFPGRTYAGLSGQAIFQTALSRVKQTRALIQKNNFNLQIVGMGGITQSEDFDTFLHAGADVAITATGALLDPLIASKYHIAILAQKNI